MKHLIIATVIFCIMIVTYRSIQKDAPINVYQGSSFTVPAHCKKLALLGCTPHPAEFLKKFGTKADITHISLPEFLDVQYLKDSFKQVLEICKHEQIDHLLIAYLPVYFTQTKALLKEKFVITTDRFLHSVAKQVGILIKDLKSEIPITLILPTKESLAQIPSVLGSSEDRVRYAVKQFPRLKGIDQSTLQTLIIINNADSDQNKGLMDYFNYEYILNKRIDITVRETSKKKFHTYI